MFDINQHVGTFDVVKVNKTKHSTCRPHQFTIVLLEEIRLTFFALFPTADATF